MSEQEKKNGTPVPEASKDASKTGQPYPNGGKGRKQRRKGGRKDGKGGTPDHAGGDKSYRPASVHNDVNWYLSNPVLSQAVGTFSMNDPLGTVYHDDHQIKFSYNDKHGAVLNGDTVKTAVPGIATFYFLPTIPLGPKVGADFFNQLAMKLYIFVRHQNSGHANYEFADLMQALYSIVSINGIYGTLTRLYGTLLKYSVLNKYKARAMVEAQGFDYDSLISRMPDLYAIIERLRCAFDAYPIPKNLPVADRQLWMTANIFKDSNDAKSPLWMFVQAAYYSVPNVNALQQAIWCPWYNGEGSSGTGRATLEDIDTLVTTIIRDLCSDEDYGIIFGDILKAYGAENCAVLKQIPRDYIVEDVFDPNANLQLHNATVLNVGAGNINLPDARILQETASHRLAFYCNSTMNDSSDRKVGLTTGDTMLLSFPKHEVTPGEFLVATRLLSRWEVTRPTGQTIWNLVQCGTEILIGGAIFYNTSTDSAGTVVTAKQYFTTAYVFEISSTTMSNINNFVDYTRFLYLYSQFESLPRSYASAYAVTSAGNLQLPTNLYGMFDLDCFVIIDKGNLDSLNYTAAMSEFGYTDAARVG